LASRYPRDTQRDSSKQAEKRRTRSFDLSSESREERVKEERREIY
jgi:hypothetical protein